MSLEKSVGLKDKHILKSKHQNWESCWNAITINNLHLNNTSIQLSHPHSCRTTFAIPRTIINETETYRHSPACRLGRPFLQHPPTSRFQGKKMDFDPTSTSQNTKRETISEIWTSIQMQFYKQKIIWKSNLKSFMDGIQMWIESSGESLFIRFPHRNRWVSSLRLETWLIEWWSSERDEDGKMGLYDCLKKAYLFAGFFIF